jgi:hypothetical protein
MVASGVSGTALLNVCILQHLAQLVTPAVERVHRDGAKRHALTLRPYNHLPGQFGPGLKSPVLRNAGLGPAVHHAVCKPGFGYE